MSFEYPQCQTITIMSAAQLAIRKYEFNTNTGTLNTRLNVRSYSKCERYLMNFLVVSCVLYG